MFEPELFSESLDSPSFAHLVSQNNSLNKERDPTVHFFPTILGGSSGHTGSIDRAWTFVVIFESDSLDSDEESKIGL